MATIITKRGKKPRPPGHVKVYKTALAARDAPPCWGALTTHSLGSTLLRGNRGRLDSMKVALTAMGFYWMLFFQALNTGNIPM